MQRSDPGHSASLAAVLVSVLALTGCFGADDSAFTPTEPQTSSESGLSKIDNSTSNRRPTKAARFLPTFAGESFQVDDIDLAARTKPLGTAFTLIETAIGDRAAPRVEVTGVEASSTPAQIQKTIDVTTAALRCLNQKGHLEMHAYVDTRHSYSMSVVLVANAKTFKNVDLRSCAINSLIPYDQDPNSAEPTIAPCVSQRTRGAAIVAWMGTTDVMCDALGGERIAASDRALQRGNTGTDVALLQLALNDIGADLTVDGRLGAATTTAVRTFQSCFPVPDARKGIADAATKDALTVAQTSGWTPEQCAASP